MSFLLAAASTEAQAKSVAFDIDHDDVQKLTGHFVKHMRAALTRVGPSQIPSYVRQVPDGTEKGTFLAVDLGGTNCRVCSIELHGDFTYTLVQSKHLVPPELRVNAFYKPLFGFIAERIQDFLADHPESDLDTVPKENECIPSEAGELTQENHRKLGFTFSFTCHQESLAKGTLLHWDKGWDIPEALGKDPCAMLQEAIDDLTLPIHVTALANDSVGTLMARAYTSPEKSSTLMSAIFGTGTNAAYIEKLQNVTKLHHQADFRDHTPDHLMVVNTEWGCFDDDMEVLPTTEYDDILDSASQDPGMQMLEKRISGLYLGELLRLVVVQLLEAGFLDMTTSSTSPLLLREGIDSSILSILARDGSESLEESRRHIADALKAQGVTYEDANAIREVAGAISRRAARLAGSAMAAVIIQSGRMQAAKALLDDESKPVEITLHGRKSKQSEPARAFAFSRFRSRVNVLLRRLLKIFGFPNAASSFFPDTSSVPRSKEETPTTIEGDTIDIGVDGSLIEFHPSFEQDIREALADVFGSGERRVRIGLAKNGSSVGAALMAASM
ncbi:Uu.00g139520.m01.CDS01 [Anthostomella pinea]|uniref:Phosphotransferase n=1 Tax=Anthostomella pinea TaxID=933095 RepID=A0AAI8YIW4_9PEZI|nr:Uu.00g139520.m01.CDS01 [Anthostomella pinea]